MQATETVKKKARRRSRTRPKPHTTNVMVWDVPIGIKARFKAACAVKGESMQAVVIHLMVQYSNEVF